MKHFAITGHRGTVFTLTNGYIGSAHSICKMALAIGRKISEQTVLHRLHNGERDFDKVTHIANPGANLPGVMASKAKLDKGKQEVAEAMRAVAARKAAMR